MLGICFGHFRSWPMRSAAATSANPTRAGASAAMSTAWKSRPAPIGGKLPEFAIACSHQDQVIAPPPDAEVFLASEFTPNAGLVYRNGAAISLQSHPEFQDDYTVALAELRRGKATRRGGRGGDRVGGPPVRQRRDGRLSRRVPAERLDQLARTSARHPGGAPRRGQRCRCVGFGVEQAIELPAVGVHARRHRRLGQLLLGHRGFRLIGDHLFERGHSSVSASNPCSSRKSSNVSRLTRRLFGPSRQIHHATWSRQRGFVLRSFSSSFSWRPLTVPSRQPRSRRARALSAHLRHRFELPVDASGDWRVPVRYCRTPPAEGPRLDDLRRSSIDNAWSDSRTAWHPSTIRRSGAWTFLGRRTIACDCVKNDAITQASTAGILAFAVDASVRLVVAAQRALISSPLPTFASGR